MNRKQKMRLKALLSKGANLSDAEKTELTGLQETAKTANYDVTKDDGSVSPEELDEAIKDGVTAALQPGGVVVKSIAEEMKKSLPESVTTAQVEEAVKKQLSGTQVDAQKIIDGVKLLIPQGVTEAQLTKAFEDFATKQNRRPSLMEYEENIEMPIAHRSGNISVAQKQILNHMLRYVSEDALVNKASGVRTVRPNDMNDGIPETVMKDAETRGRKIVESMKSYLRYGGAKALTSAGVGSGFELTNTELSTDLQARLYMESQFAQLMQGQEINMPSEPFRFPLTTVRPTFFVGSENGAMQTSTPGTGSIILTATKLISQVDYSYEADEDSLVAVLPMVQKLMGEAAADAYENALINGDSTGAQDSDYGAITNDSSKLFDGLRKYAIAGALTVDLSTNGISAAAIGAMRKAMGIYGMKVADLMIIAGVSGYQDLVMLPETLTLQLVGPGARILTGTAPSIFGIPIVPSARVRENLNAAGKYDGATVNLGSILMIHKPSWIVGTRRNFLLETWRDTRTQTNSVIVSFRRAFQPKETPSATLPTGNPIKSVAMGFNYAA